MQAHRGQENAIVLLSCVKSKRRVRCKAGNMYTSPLFQKMMAYAQTKEHFYPFGQVRSAESG